MSESVVRDVAVLIYGLVSFLLGGGTVIVGIGFVADKVLKSPVLVAGLENLAKSAHPDLLKALNVSAKLVEEVTDDVPAVDKPPVDSAVNPPADLAEKLEKGKGVPDESQQ